MFAHMVVTMEIKTVDWNLSPTKQFLSTNQMYYAAYFILLDIFHAQDLLCILMAN